MTEKAESSGCWSISRVWGSIIQPGHTILHLLKVECHSRYEITLKYYLRGKGDLVDKARRAVRHKVAREMFEKCLGREQ